MLFLIVNHDGETKTQGKPIRLCWGGRLDGSEPACDSFSLAAPKEQQGIHPGDTVCCAEEFSDSWPPAHESEITIYLGQKSYSINR
jgi:hypothetical protein